MGSREPCTRMLHLDQSDGVYYLYIFVPTRQNLYAARQMKKNAETLKNVTTDINMFPVPLISRGTGSLRISKSFLIGLRGACECNVPSPQPSP